MANCELTKSKKEIMNIIWDAQSPLMIQEILDEVKKRYNKEWRPQTLSSFLRSLVAKGLLEYHRRNMFSFYWSCMSREEYGSYMQKQLLEEWFDGSCKQFLSTFIQKCHVSKETINEVIQEIE